MFPLGVPGIFNSAGGASYLPKVSHWLDASIDSSFTLSGTKVLTWTDKINSNVWNDFDAGKNVTFTSGDGYALFNSGALDFLNSIQDNTELLVVGQVTGTHLGDVHYMLGSSESSVGMSLATPTLDFYTSYTPSTVYKTFSRAIGGINVYSMSWIHTTQPAKSLLIGNRQNMASTNRFNGRIYDVIIFSSLLTTDERDDLYVDIKIKHPGIVNLP